MENSRIIIIGAGLSGLAATQRLLNRGCTNVVILEAKNRVGGRIQTKKYGSSYIELGAQWIHGEGSNPIYKLAEKHHLLHTEDDNREFRDDFFTQDGHQISADIVEETCDILDDMLDYANIFAREGKPLTCEDDSIGTYSRQAFNEYLQTALDDGEMKQKREIFNWKMVELRTENGCRSVDELSLYSWGQYLEYEGSEDVVLKFGYGQIIELIQATIPPECFHLSSEVQSIQYSPSNVAVTLSDGVTHLADHVVFTGSLGVLKSQAHQIFNPPLPGEKLDVIERMGFGTVNKIYLEFEQAFWDDGCGSLQLVWLPEKLPLKCLDEEHIKQYGEWYRSIHSFDVVDHHTTVLCGWIPGLEAEVMEKVGDETVLDVCHELLTQFTGRRDIPKPIRIIKTCWSSDPYTRGSYSYIKAGHTAADCQLLATPLPDLQNPRLMFAGEATSLSYFSTTHGALLSGQREADRIVDFLHAAQ